MEMRARFDEDVRMYDLYDRFLIYLLLQYIYG